MKWGVRKATVSGGGSGGSATSRGEKESADSKTAGKIQDRINKGGTKVLSNKEMQDVITRMNLEQQYSRLHASQSTVDAGHEKVKKLLGQFETANRAYAAYNSPLGKLAVKGVKLGVRAARNPGVRAAASAAVLL